MKTLKKVVSLLLIIVLTTVVFTACSNNDNTGKFKNEKAIIVGSKDFTESIIVSELYAIALENAGYKIERKQSLGATPILHAAMLSGDIDLIAEYTSTGIALVLKADPEFDANKAYEKVKAGYLTEYNLAWLAATAVNNSQGLAVTKEISDKYSFTKLSQLPEMAPHIRMCATPEFEERADGLKGLKEKLGAIKFASLRVYDKSLKYEILRSGEADMNVCFTTDADLAGGNIIALQDDVSFWPPYTLAPVIRKEVLDASPEVEELLNKVSSHMNNATMQKLNALVDIDRKEYADVAKTALQEWGIIN